MGPGIALAFAEAGWDVRLWGRSSSRVAGGLARIRRDAAFLEEHGLGGAAGDVVSRVAAMADLSASADADLVIEAVSEDLALKRSLFAELDGLCAPSALLATNTSGLRVGDLAADATRRERVVAMHFWNPAHLMPIVEIAGGPDTSAASLARAHAVAERIGKAPVRVAADVFGFLGTRMQQAVLREAIALLERRAASAEDIDLAVRTSFGARFPAIGPLESADLSGLDVISAIHRYLLPDLDASTSPQGPLRDRVALGHLGAKTGRGFHEWPPERVRLVERRRDEELVRRLRLMIDEGLVRPPAAAREAG